MPVIVVCERCGSAEAYPHVGKTKDDPLGQAGADGFCDLREGVTCSKCTAEWKRWMDALNRWRDVDLRHYGKAAVGAWMAGAEPPPVPPPPMPGDP